MHYSHTSVRLEASDNEHECAARAHARIAIWGALVLLASMAWAGDPWKDKSYKEWNMEDVQKILGESPWVKTVSIDAPWIKGQPHYLQGMQVGCGGRPDLNRPMKPPPRWAMETITQSIVAYQVTWQSARTIRAARFRMAVLCGRTDPEEGGDLLEQEPEQYIILVTSPDMTPFDGMEEEALLKNTFLLIKKTNQKIKPEAVGIGHGIDQRTVYGLTFKFPKKTETGEPVIPADEKEIEFVCQSGKAVVKTKFQPPKMIGKNGADL